MIAAYSPEARGCSERAFGTHQGRLPQALALASITRMEAANRSLQEVYLPRINAEFKQPTLEEGSAFMPWLGGNLDDILCEQFECTVGADNCVRFEKLILQIPVDRHLLPLRQGEGAGTSLWGRPSGRVSWAASAGRIQHRGNAHQG